MEAATVVLKWGNSEAVRIPPDILRQAQVGLNDTLYVEVDGDNRIVLTKTTAPKEGTLEFLFKDYAGGAFASELADLGEAVGNERW